jgi:hypothetical protein
MKVIKRPPKMKLVGIERWSYREPPRFRRILPPEIPGATSDWDFNQSLWNLDTGTYISSPSSLKMVSQTCILCKYAGTTNISQGQIITWAKTEYGPGASYVSTFEFWFRNQSPVGSFSYTRVSPPYAWIANNGYTIVFYVYAYGLYIYRDTTQIYYTSSWLNKPSSWTSWNKYRITWWTDTGGAGLMIRIEWWNGSSWVTMVNDINDSQDKYKDSTINRVGGGSGASAVWFDDTEIWSA